ncbi:MAG: OmpA family protein [Acidobacteriota bacterium]|nr:OmpA family protein [Acidobacteriota bacterium]MDH3784583.1 OmpA family protein [Acidobacteriota bacterium]
MLRKLLKTLIVLPVLAISPSFALENSVDLHSVSFPERLTVSLPIAAIPGAPQARLSADVNYRKGQASIDLTYSAMKPAILYGGDVTCYVVWAITRDGTTENLGELLTRKMSGRLSFKTGQKSFGLLVTAESYYLVNRPSQLVVFRSLKPTGEPHVVTPFTFDKLEPAPRHGMDNIEGIRWDSRVPLELLQARKAFELATRMEAGIHAGDIHAEAGVAMDEANKIAQSAPKSRELLDSARRAVALSNQALNISARRVEALEIERQIAERRAETAALEQRAAEAEQSTIQAQELAQLAKQAADTARLEAEQVRLERERMATETTALRTEKATLESSMSALRQETLTLQTESSRLERERTAFEQESLRLRDEKARIEREKAELESTFARVQMEKNQLAGRLESALSHVADTTDSARGYVVNLPDILFDVNEATLKVDAQLVLSKLAGILLIMPEQKVEVEGHTDSTGGAEYNLDLSQRRANSVLSLLRSQGLEADRLQAVGFGMQQPVADNDTAAGRSKNRRVEIVISSSGS